MNTRQDRGGVARRVFTEAVPVDQLGPAKSASCQASRWWPTRRLAIPSPRRPDAGAVSGIQGAEADGLCRLVSSREPSHAELRESLEKTAPQRRVVLLRTRDVGGARLRIPLRLLGLLHMEIVQERLEREFNMDPVTTAPGVLYRVTKTDGEVIEIDSPAKLPETGHIDKIEEPVITAMILTPAEFVGAILQDGRCRRRSNSSPRIAC